MRGAHAYSVDGRITHCIIAARKNNGKTDPHPLGVRTPAVTEAGQQSRNGIATAPANRDGRKRKATAGAGARARARGIRNPPRRGREIKAEPRKGSRERRGVLVGEERRGGRRDALDDGADHLGRHEAPVHEDVVRPGLGGGGGGGRSRSSCGRRRRRHGHVEGVPFRFRAACRRLEPSGALSDGQVAARAWLGW